MNKIMRTVFGEVSLVYNLHDCLLDVCHHHNDLVITIINHGGLGLPSAQHTANKQACVRFFAPINCYCH